MKKIILLQLLFISSTLTIGAVSNEKEALNLFNMAGIAYQKQDYNQSIKLYEEIIHNNYIASGIYYNLGNAYFKNGNIAKAILNYERALKINPEDEDTNFNLKIASLKVVDKIENVPEIFYKKWINSLSTMLTAGAWAILLIIATWLLFISAGFYAAGRTVAVRKTGFIFMLSFFLVSVFFGIIGYRSHAIAYVDEKAIVMSASVYVKSSPDEKGNDLFILHEGTRIEILDELSNWKKIRIANGSIGWMKAEEMEKI